MANRWTSADLLYLRDNYGHVRAEEIANNLGRTVDSIHYKASAMHIRFHEQKKEQPDRLERIEEILHKILALLEVKQTRGKTLNLGLIKQRHAEGFTPKQIALELRCSLASVYNVCSANGLKFKKPPLLISSESQAIIKRRYLSDRYADIGADLFLSATQIAWFVSSKVKSGEWKPKNNKR